MHFPFDNSYSRLPPRFYARVAPTPVAAPRMIRVNRALAEALGLDADWLASPAGAEILSGQRVPEAADPIALAYAGHQFGNFVPQLGDGRAVLLGEVVGRDGARRDIQLKGAGRTPFSRGGDGRAAMGPVLREYIVSEAMHALGIPTTRSLAAVATGEPVLREGPLPGAVLTRVASSHIRVGTFQYFAARGDTEGIRLLADYVIGRHYPELQGEARPYHALLAAVTARQADLIARWLLVGFIHGVMNTDNCSVSGETIDYGPCAFLDTYEPGKVFSSIDMQGRYAYANQPRIAQWNLARLAETLLPLLGDEEDKAVSDAQDILGDFAPRFTNAYLDGLNAKIGLGARREGDDVLSDRLLKAMAENQADFTITFRHLARAAESADGDAGVRRLFADPMAYDLWAADWRQRLAAEPMEPAARGAAMRAVNPAYIPRNHRIEAVIEAAVTRSDFAPFHAMADVLARPFEDQPGQDAFAEPPQPHEEVQRTFCGT